MLALLESLFRNIAPFVAEIAVGLAMVFAVSFVVGWLFARQSAHNRRRRKGG